MAHGGEGSTATTPLLSTLSAVTSAHTTTVKQTALLGSPGRTVSPAIERNRVRPNDLVTGCNFQIRDCVGVNNPQEGQPRDSEIIGATCDQLVKVEGTINIDGQDVVIVVRRASKNVTLENSSLL